MAPPYQNSFPSHHHHDLDDHLFFPTTPQPSSSSSSTLSFPLALDHAHSDDHSRSLDLKQDQGGEIVGCNNDNEGIRNDDDDDVETGLRFSIWKQIDNDSALNLNWASSSSSNIRMLINNSNIQTEIPMAIDGAWNFQDLNQSSPSDDLTNKRSSTLNVDDSNPVIRTCSDCNTTKTPLWRSGPRGPKSLCNACGIRQRKARRAAMAAAAEEAANGTVPYGGKPVAAAVLKTNKTARKHKIIKPATGVATLKKKCKNVSAGSGGGGGGGRKKLLFEDSSYQRVFPQDEREAAILLMTLSYGWPSSWFKL